MLREFTEIAIAVPRVLIANCIKPFPESALGWAAAIRRSVFAVLGEKSNLVGKEALAKRESDSGRAGRCVPAGIHVRAEPGDAAVTEMRFHRR
jgi:hypothetical protein